MRLMMKTGGGSGKKVWIERSSGRIGRCSIEPSIKRVGVGIGKIQVAIGRVVRE